MADAKAYAVYPPLNENASPQQYDLVLVGDNLNENTKVEVRSGTHTWQSHKCKPHGDNLLFVRLKPATHNGTAKKAKGKFKPFQIEQITVTVQNGSQAPAPLVVGPVAFGVIDDPD